FDMGLVRSDANPPELRALETSIERTIARVFGDNTPDYARYKAASEVTARFMAFSAGYPAVKHYREQIATRIENETNLLKEGIRGLEEDVADAPQEETALATPAATPETARRSRKVFIVHGHDEGPREGIARFLAQLDLPPIILHEQPNRGRTIIT